MGLLGVNDTVRISGTLLVAVVFVVLLTESVGLPCVAGICAGVSPVVSLSRLFKYSILMLTVIGFVFSYENWTSPKTSLVAEKTRAAWDERTGNYGIVLRNDGTTDATLRVKVRLDGEEPFPDERDAANCLYANIPHSSPFPGAEPYPKRSRIARDDFRLFRNTKEWSIDMGPEETYRIQTTAQALPSLPIDGEAHEVDFEVQQTGERYVFTYDSDETITDIQRDRIREVKKRLSL